MGADSEGGPVEVASEPAPDAAPEIGDVVDELEELEAETSDPETRAQLAAVTEMVTKIQSPAFGRVIRGYDRADAAEAFLGSLIFGIPMMVEGGTVEVGAHLGANPLALLGSVVAAIATVWGILYVTDIQDVRIHEPLFGLIPRRFAGVLVIAAVTAAALTTGWGRVDWAEPVTAAGTVVVAFVPMAIGGALGDILPGS